MTQENNYKKQYPDIMSGKRILYIHGFCSSGQSGTVTKLKEFLPSAEFIAPDLPLHPQEAIDLLHKTCKEEHPDLIIGTSMGGMYAEMLYGYDRILVNPAFQMGDTILKNNMLGKNTILNPRQDGIQEFIMTKALMEEYKDITQQCFKGVNEEERRNHVYGLFGDADPTVHTFDLFCEHYLNAIHFHGEHRMNDDILYHSVIPVIRWIDDRQNGKERSIIYISIDALRADDGRAKASAQKAYRYLLENYDMYIVASAPTNDHQYAECAHRWVEEYINVPGYNRLIMTNHKNLLYGDYLIDPNKTEGADGFMGTQLQFGEDPFKTWDDTIEYFSRLGGQ